MRSKNDYLDYLEHRIQSNNELYHYGVLGMHWGVRRYQPYSQVPRKSGKGGEEKIVATNKDFYNKSKINTKTSSKIKWSSSTEGRVSFGGNKNCLCTIEPEDEFFEEPGGNKKDIESIVSDSKFESVLRNSATDNLYEWRLDKLKAQTKEEFKKKLQCEQITSTKPNNAVIWYSHPDDYGDWMMEVDVKNKKIVYEEYYR